MFVWMTDCCVFRQCRFVWLWLQLLGCKLSVFIFGSSGGSNASRNIKLGPCHQRQRQQLMTRFSAKITANITMIHQQLYLLLRLPLLLLLKNNYYLLSYLFLFLAVVVIIVMYDQVRFNIRWNIRIQQTIKVSVWITQYSL